MMRAFFTTALAVGTAASLGCGAAAEPELTAGAPERSITVNDAEVASEAGVQVRVMPVTVTSQYQNEMEYRPVRVEIRNRSARPLRIRYDAFALADQTGGDSLDAVSVYKLDRAEVGGPGIDNFPTSPPPTWEHDNFAIAPGYEEIFPDVARYEGAFDTTAVNAYRAPGATEPAALRDRVLLADVVPEGVIRPGGLVEGTLWFQDADEPIRELVFTFDLIDAATGEQFGDMSVPFDAMRSRLERGTEVWQARRDTPAAGGAMMGAEPVTVTVILASPDPASMTARRVRLDSVKVQRVTGDKTFWVGPDAGPWLLTVLDEMPTPQTPTEGRVDVNPGNTVTITGMLRQPPAPAVIPSDWNLPPADVDRLAEARLYLVADRVEKVGTGY